MEKYQMNCASKKFDYVQYLDGHMTKNILMGERTQDKNKLKINFLKICFYFTYKYSKKCKIK